MQGVRALLDATNSIVKSINLTMGWSLIIYFS